MTHVAVTAMARQRSTMLADLITLYRTQHALVFVNTKREADDLVSELGLIIKGTEALHGDIPQTVREKILNGFRSGRIPVLIATDVRPSSPLLLARVFPPPVSFLLPGFCDCRSSSLSRPFAVHAQVAESAHTPCTCSRETPGAARA